MKIKKEIERLIDQCLETDYSQPKSVNKHNRLVVEIRKLIETIDDDKIKIELLNDNKTNNWAAFQLLEAPEKCSIAVYKLSINILKLISKIGSSEALAAKWRLKELEK